MQNGTWLEKKYTKIQINQILLRQVMPGHKFRASATFLSSGIPFTYKKKKKKIKDINPHCQVFAVLTDS